MTRATKKTAPFQFGEHDVILHAWSEPCGGPGWSNAPVKVLVLDWDKRVRIEYLQPTDQTRDMVTLYSTSAASHAAMTNAVVAESATWNRGKK